MSILNNYIKYEKNSKSKEALTITKYGQCVIRKGLDRGYWLNQYKTVDFYYSPTGIALHFKKSEGNIKISDSYSRYFYLTPDFVKAKGLEGLYTVQGGETDKSGGHILTFVKIEKKDEPKKIPTW